MRVFSQEKPSTMGKVAIIMGSDSDWPTMRHAADKLTEFGVEHECKVVSAHRTPELLYEFASSAKKNGFSCIIAGAGGAAHLPGMTAAMCTLPVLGVPVAGKHFDGHDSLLSIVQMPKGVPVATFAIGESGAINAALFAVSMLANNDDGLAEKLTAFRNTQKEAVLAKVLPPKE